MMLTLLLAAMPCPLPPGAPGDSPATAAACALLTRPSPAPVSTSGLAAIYRRPGFERAGHREEVAWAAWLAQLRARVLDLFESRGAERYSSATRVAVLGMALGAAVLALLRVRRGRPGPGSRPQPPLLAEAAGGDGLATQLAGARALAPSAPREALRLGLQALLGWLEGQRLAGVGRARTNREVAAELAARGATASLASELAQLLAWYDGVFYSLAPVSAREVEDFLARLGALTGAER